jgi:hypothetical protein
MGRRRMKPGKPIFTPLVDFFTRCEFRKCVDRRTVNHKVISFSCWDQYLCRAFVPLTDNEREVTTSRQL